MPFFGNYQIGSNMDIKAKMHNQDVYYCDDVDLVAEQTQCLEVLYDFNHTRPSEGKKRQ